MAANEVQLEPIISEDNRSDDQWANDDYYDEEGEAEETLSLCDLPIYSGSEDRSSSSKEDYQSSSDDQDDLFEFFSQDLSASSSSSSTCAYAENIFFCGKLLPYQIPALLSQETNHKLHQTNTQQQQQPPSPKKKTSFFQWRSKSLNKSKTTKENTAKHQINSNDKKNCSEHEKMSSLKALALPASNKCNANKKRGYSIKKVSVLTSPTKSRWYLFFGMARFPTEMKLSDIKIRQHRQTPSSSSATLFPSFNKADEGKEVKAGRTGRGKGLWGLLRILGGRNSHASTVAKASFGCIPHA